MYVPEKKRIFFNFWARATISWCGRALSKIVRWSALARTDHFFHFSLIFTKIQQLSRTGKNEPITFEIFELCVGFSQ
jgi:hypothetical protein